jgi:hypothetical protein
MSARSGEPRNPDAPANLQRIEASAYHVNPPDDFMARNNRKLWIRQLAVDNMKIGAAYTAGADANPNLAVGGLRIRPLDKLEPLTGAFEHHCAHLTLAFSRISSSLLRDRHDRRHC